jgi:hypothetical protein
VVQIALALRNYHDDYGCFPPAYIVDESGQAIHSWRVLRLPYLDEETLFQEYRFDQSWNGPNNFRLAGRMPAVYRCPGHGRHAPEAGECVTNYLAVVDSQAVFRGESATRLSDVGGEPFQTLLLIDMNRRSVHWMAPDDITADDFVAQFSGDTVFNHPEGTMVAFVDASTSFLPQTTDHQKIRVLLTCAAADDANLAESPRRTSSEVRAALRP